MDNVSYESSGPKMGFPRSVGQGVSRIDSRKKVTGDAIYGSDIDTDELLYAAVLRSTNPHGIVSSIGHEQARKLQGVVHVVERTELMGGFDNRVRHYGDIIAAVAAEDPATASQAIHEITYEIEPKEPVFDPKTAFTDDAPTIHPINADFGQHTRHELDIKNQSYVQNIDDYHFLSIGDTDHGFTQADVVLEETYRSPRVSHCNLDTHCCIAEWEGDVLVLTETLGSPGRGQEELAALLGMNENQIRIRSPSTASSSFGGRSLRKLTLEPVAATLAKDTDRPVKLWFDREEEFIATETRHRTEYRIKSGGNRDGSLTALSINVLTDTGGYPNGVGHIVLTNSRDRPLDLYTIENYDFEGVSVYTNNVPAGEYRGIGSTQLHFALESHLDELSYKLGIEPTTLRKQNFVEEGHTRPHTGVPIESCGVQDCLHRGFKAFQAVRSGPSASRDTFYGWGFAAGSHTTGYGGFTGVDASEVKLTINPAGRIRVNTAAIDHGQGSETVIAQIIGEETGIPPTNIDVSPVSTTDELDDLLGSIASRTTYVIGEAVRDAAETLAETLRDHAGRLLEVPRSEIDLMNGEAVAANGQSVPIDQCVPEPGICAFGRGESAATPPSYGVHFVELVVDPVTGQVDIRTYVAAQDVGFAINPQMVEGQLEGALQHGIEFALTSELKLEHGNPVNATLADYPCISPFEMPDTLDIEIIESNESSGPYGAKGIGTPAMPPIAPAITNALRDATGTRFYDAPCTSSAIHRALQAERAETHEEDTGL